MKKQKNLFSSKEKLIFWTGVIVGLLAGIFRNLVVSLAEEILKKDIEIPTFALSVSSLIVFMIVIFFIFRQLIHIKKELRKK